MYFSVQLCGSDTTPELAEPYFYYGQALLYLGLSEQQVFGNDIVKGDWFSNSKSNLFIVFLSLDEDNDENEDENDDEQQVEEEKTEAATEKKNTNNTNNNDDDDKDDESIPDDEHVNDLERAFEILECAHMIYSKLAEGESTNAHIITRLGDIHVMLADICNENGDHETALTHVLQAIDLQETINDQQRDRLLAESFYKLGLIYELINKYSEAVESFDKSLSIIRKAIESMTEIEKENEREELKSLLPAIELRRNDAQASIADKHLIAQARSIISGSNGTNESTTTTSHTTDATPVQDLTLSVRRKRPVDEVEKTEEEKKKPKTDEN